jgi:hypothetical protein
MNWDEFLPAVASGACLTSAAFLIEGHHGAAVLLFVIGVILFAYCVWVIVRGGVISSIESTLTGGLL